MSLQRFAIWTVILLLVFVEARGQSFGVELLNNGMPAAGGMAGASIAAPQDLQSAINGNPATLRQFRGTQTGFGGVWIEPTYVLGVDAPGLPLIGVDPFQGKSDAQGLLGVNIGVTQEFTSLGLPLTAGIGVISGAGAGVDFRNFPEANGTHANLVALDTVSAVGVDLTERWSLGGSIILSTATLDGPFVGISGSSSDYALRGSLGVNYALRPDTNLGFYWQSEASYTFENNARFQLPGSTVTLDTRADRPEIIGLGISNSSLFNGRLLLAMDAVYQAYSETSLFGAIFNDQWSLQFGAQFAVTERMRLRIGYAWNENPMRDAVGGEIGGVLPPGAAEHVQYIEALFAAIPQHRITGGVGILDVMPGVDLDLFAGGMFEESQTFGITTATVESYWVGFGFTWRCGRGALPSS